MSTHTIPPLNQRQSLYLNIDHYSYDSEIRRSPQSLSPASFETNTNSSYESAPPLCTVLCMHDWPSDDPSHLSFTKNDILDIVKQEESGWWAAMRNNDSDIGWIPQAFVERIPEDMVDRLRNTPKQCRCQEYNAELLYANTFEPSSFEPIEPPSPSPPSPRLKRRAPEPSVPHLTVSTKIRDFNMPPGMETDSTYRVVVQRIHSDSNSHQAPLLRTSHSSSYPQKPGQYISPVDPDYPLRHHRSGTLPISAVSATRRDDPQPPSSTAFRRVYELDRPHTAFSKSKNAIEGLLKRTNSQRLPPASYLDETSPSRSVGNSFLKPLYADQLEYDDNGQLRFGTLKALVEKLTAEIPAPDIESRTAQTLFITVFLTTFRTFTTADKLFDLLVETYEMDPPKDLTPAESDGWKKHLVTTQTRVLEVFTLWLTDHRLLQDDAHIARRLTEFLRGIQSPPLASAARLLGRQIDRLTFSIHSPTSPKRTKKSKTHKNDLTRIDPVDIAEQLTLIESERYVKVTPKECVLYYDKSAPIPNLLEFCSNLDKIGSWVKTTILTTAALGKRAQIVEHWVKVAEKCKALNNFASMSAIIVALSSTVISRLHLTWAHVGRKNVFDALLKHNEPTGGFAGYRNLVQSVEPESACVPFISMYLTDLVHIQDLYNDDASEGRICFIQRQRSYDIIHSILRFQSRSYDIAESENVMEFIKKSLQTDGEKDGNWFWAKSQEVQRSELEHADIRKGLEAAGF
ncbi:hypothetical protein H0H92_009841 [Tricholoma furcatifolium]|nr:hypothetical protein H0H92_009841 [Tricholoma furcatifolium]